MRHSLLLLICCGLATASDVIVQTTNMVDSKIYVDLETNRMCYRILNGTHQIGCQTKQKGSVGTLWRVTADPDLDWVLSDKGGASPYVVLMNISDSAYNEKSLRKLRECEHVSGMIIFKNKTGSSGRYSFDSTCPNEYMSRYYKDADYGSCKKGEWNTAGVGQGFWLQDWPFPVALLVNKTEMQLATECFDRWNKPPGDGKPRKFPLCAAEFDFFMNAAVDTPTCLRRNTLFTRMDARYTDHNCDPMSGKNIYAFVPKTSKNVNSSLPKNSTLVIATRMDAFSAFNAYSPGKVAAMSGLVTLLATMDALTSAMKDFKQHDPTKHVLFVMFNGESLDYIGSSRLLYDMKEGKFPDPLNGHILNQSALLDPGAISQWIEIDQVGTNDLYLHIDPISYKNDSVKAVVDSMQHELVQWFTMKPADTNHPLPPSSAHTFLKELGHMPTVVIGDHEKAFTNKFYNGPFDTLDDALISGKDSLTTTFKGLSNTLAKYAYKFLTNEDPPTPNDKDKKSIADRLEQLMNCFLGKQSNCNLFKNVIISNGANDRLTSAIAKWEDVANATMSTYMGPSRSGLISHLPSAYALAVASYILAEEKVHMNKSDQDKCGYSTFDSHDYDTVYTYAWMVDIWAPSPDTKGVIQGFCVKSLARNSTAESPAFVIDGYDFASGKYSTWVESIWNHYPKLRLFLKPSTSWENTVLAVGIVVAVLSFIVVFVVERNADLLFMTQVSSV